MKVLARYLSVLSPPGKPSLREGGEGRGEEERRGEMRNKKDYKAGFSCVGVSTPLTELSP